MLLSDFHYPLPPELIADRPTQPRDHSRLMVVHRQTQTIEHAHFYDLAKWIDPEDLLILNDTKVIPARLRSGKIEILLLEETSPRHWIVIGQPGKKLKPGVRLFLDPLISGVEQVEIEVLKTLPDGTRVIRFFGDVDLQQFGTMPLPPYIEEARRAHNLPLIQPEDATWYQPIHAHYDGSVAAPTAGLHFTPELLATFNHAFVTLHVGLATFRPVKVEHIEDHEMHTERYTIPENLAERAQQARRVVAVGTTTARVLESVPDIHPSTGKTNIYIYPPYKFKRVDALITNFHLPGSSLILLVAAFMGQELQRRAYEEAIREQYRFYSYGDAMLIL
ncbi:MAG: tRNA preQ1(34) S-adenosylmethionine ribosyltransferase-isomerase QueA [Verrucomicrobiota bacterium]